MTTADLLEGYNRLRIEAGKKPIKTWKESTAKLEAAIAAFIRADQAPPITVSEIAKEIGIDPRVARAKLRRSNLEHTRGKGWVFPSSDKQTIIDLLKR